MGTEQMSHITVEITFLPKGRNVRAGPIVGRSLGCEMLIDGSLYAVRFDLQPGKSIQLGSTAILEATFDDPEVTRGLLAVGKNVTLWERGAIGHGRVVKAHAG